MAKKRKRGRPRVRPKNSTPLAVRFTAAERRLINAAAKRAEMSAAQWMRTVILREVGG